MLTPLLITHLATIRDLTGAEPNPGGRVVVRLRAAGELGPVGTITPP